MQRVFSLVPISLQDFVYRGQPALHGPGGGAGLNRQLIHLFRAQGQCLLFDGSTGALVRLGEGPFASWQRYLADPDGSAPAQTVAGTAGPTGLAELLELGLFRQPLYPGGAMLLGASGLHSLCLNVAHACDLACGYCFAGGGDYGQPLEGPAIMSLDTAKRALDYLLLHSPPGRTVSVDFFGGEPLLAWDTLTGAVAYGRQQARSQGKQMLFTLTTNGCSLDPERAQFCAANMSTIIVSIDGRPETHNRLRQGRGGAPSYSAAVAGAHLLQLALGQTERLQRPEQPGQHEQHAQSERFSPDRPDRPLGSGPLWVRGTYTAYNLDFWRDVEHLVELGFDQISMEPVSVGPGGAEPYRLEPHHLPVIQQSYAHIADMAAAGRLRFFHFELNTGKSACAPKRYSGCAAGAGYGCVNPRGVLYPCHQFDGQPEWAQGLLEGLTSYQFVSELAGAHVGAKAACRECWAQLHCGGGCHFGAWRHSGALNQPDPLACLLGRARIEAALGLQAFMTGGSPPAVADQT